MKDEETILWDKYYPSGQNLFPGIDRDKAEQNNIFNVFGHTSVDKVYMNAHMANIDTGVYRNNLLTALHYPSMTLLQQRNIESADKT